MRFKFFCILALALCIILPVVGENGYTDAANFDAVMDNVFVEAEMMDFNVFPLTKEKVEMLTSMYDPKDPIFKFIRAIYAPLPGGIDHLAAGAGTRNMGYGTIRLRGLPPDAKIVGAELYFGVIYGAGPIPAKLPVKINQFILYDAMLIGTSAQPCWSGTTFAVYRAYVTPYVFGNGEYLIKKLPSSITDGRDPWKYGSGSPPLSEGVSLVVYYSHSSVPNNSFVQTHKVIQMFSSSLNINHVLGLPIGNNAYLKHTRLGADGQVGGGLSNTPSTAGEKTFINTTQIRGPGAALNQDSDWNGTDGEPLNQLWDTHTMLIPRTIPNGAISYLVRYTASGDCIVPVVHVLTALF